jgi:anaerobic selenocysteine-containing dehydrogenase
MTTSTTQQVRTVATACRICAVACGTLVELDGDEVVRITGDPDDPWSKGYTCSKGRAGPEFHRDPQRLDVPQIRRAGEMVDATWDEALDDIAARLQAVVDERGPSAVAHYTGTGGPLDPSGYALAHGFFRALGTDQAYSALSIDCAGKFLVPELVAGVQMQFQPDLAHTDLLLAIGVNTVVSHGHGLMMPNPLVHLRDLRARGGRVVVVDPRRTETTHHADLHLAVRPGTDPALLAFAVRHVLRTRADQAYLADCADPAGLERLRALVEPFTNERAAEVCGLDVADVDAFADLLNTAGRIGIETGTGVSMGRSANLTEWLVWALGAVTGSLDRLGGSTFNPGFLRAMEDGLPGGRGDLAPRPPSRPDLPRIVNGEMPCAALADEIESGAVRALVVRMGNPALAIPDNERLARALASLDLLVAIDARPTQTTALATHVLPVADHFERADLVTGYLQAAPFLRFAPAVVEPTGERRAQWWMFAELSRRMGLPLFGSARRDAALADVELDDETIAEAMAGQARRPWDEVRAQPYGIRDESMAPGWMIPGRLPRLLDLAPPELVDQFTGGWLEQLPAGGQLVMINRRTPGQYNSLAPRPPAGPTLLVHPADAARHGLDDGDTTEISTVSGCCQAQVELSDTMLPGVVSLPHAYPSANVNHLTSTADIDPLNGMPILSGFAVSLSGPLAVE